MVLGVAELLVVTDYFVIATGNNDRQVKVIADEVVDRLKKAGLRPVGIEGEREARWILVDFVDVVVHVFQREQREFYRLEKLWSDAEHVPLPEEIAGDATA